MNFIVNTIKNIGGRAPGSIEELKCAKRIAQELEKYCDQVTIEEFDLHPDAFLGFISLVFSFYVAGVLLFLFVPLASAIFSFLGFLILYEEFFKYNEFIDELFPKKQSQNVLGIKKPKNEDIENIVIISGHHDSAHEFRLLAKSPYLYVITIFFGISSVVLLLILNITWIIQAILFVVLNYIFPEWVFIALYWLWLYLIIMIPIMSPLLFFKSKKAVPGAVDNLSAIGAMLSVAKTLKALENEKLFSLDNTEIWFISFGSEEAGLRGSRRFVEKHFDELVSKRTFVINMDTLADPSELHVVIEEKTTRTKHSKMLAEYLLSIAKENKLPLSTIKLPSIGGGTDAVSFSRAGIDAVTLFAAELSFKTFRYYHTMRDTPDKINKDVLKIVHDLIIAFIKDVNLLA